MKLAEALALRGDTQKRIAQLRSRIVANAHYQESDTPVEDAAALLAEVELAVGELEVLVRSINATNSAIQLEIAPKSPSGGRRRQQSGAATASEVTMTDALARRDSLRLRHSILVEAADAAQDQGMFRQMRSELRQISALQVPDLRAQADTLARELRELDAQIQQANWLNDLVEG
ncbi:DIP1984 family protein [Leucobacter aridicollis]|uniref:DIP1984 family protein n=1 Tax=Leucobacter aridicollis TaxID=283878 RepID=UPI002105806C|nr:DIP1984 family protein [Leucobacter aridicollis]UTX54552.1 DIP1984 family protein [Leucobacter aridicollis]